MRCRVLRLIVAAAAIVVCGRGLASAQTSDDLFNDQVLHRVDVYIYSKDWALLRKNFRENTHYPADLRWQGMAVRNASVRSQGRHSRFGPKPSLQFNFDHYASGQRFLGLRSLVLKNLLQDHSGVRDFLAMKMLRRLGVPAPRVAFAAVYVNNVYGGLYAMVENIDTVAAERMFGESSGTLFEYHGVDVWGFSYLGPDLAPYASRFEPANHETDPPTTLYDPFEAWCRLVNEASDSEFSSVIGRYVDAVGTMRLVAAQAFMAEVDGLVGSSGMANVFVYRPAGTTVHRFAAWDEDQACWTTDLPVTRNHDQNVLVRRLLEIPEIRQDYFATLLRAADYADEVVAAPAAATARQGTLSSSPARATVSPDAAGGPPGAVGRGVRARAGDGRAAGEGARWLESEALRALNLIRAAFYQDTLKTWTNEEFEAAATYVVEFCRNRAAFVRSQVGQ